MAVIGLLSPGDMGSGVARVLRHNGARVVTALDGRSARTRELAAGAGVEDTGTVDELVDAADIVVSIVPPAAARDVAHDVARAIGRSGSETAFLDANAIAPATAHAVANAIGAAGGVATDGGIIGGPPRVGAASTRFYVSGPHAHDVGGVLSSYGLSVRHAGERIGDASAVKMCYAALTKGQTALAVELLTTAHRLGVAEVLEAELAVSQKNQWDGFEARIPAVLATRSGRWVGEMEEIAATFRAAGVPGGAFDAAAAIYRLAAATSMGDETPERFDRSRTLAQAIALIAEAIEADGC